MSETVQFKFIVIGCSGTGKTSLLRRLVDGKFLKDNQSTVGIEYFTYITTIDKKTIKMMIWDTAGQERFYTIAKAYFRSALGIILVFDICDRKSFDQLPRWLRDARMEADPHCSVMLVGNKIDMAAERTVSQEEAQQFAKTHELNYIETSAKSGEQVQDAFIKTAQELVAKCASGEISTASTQPAGGAPIVKIDNKKKNKNNGCC